MEVEKDKEIDQKSSTNQVNGGQKQGDVGGVESCMTTLITIFSWILILLFFPLALPMCIRTVQVSFFDKYIQLCILKFLEYFLDTKLITHLY